jgi:protease II
VSASHGIVDPTGRRAVWGREVDDGEPICRLLLTDLATGASRDLVDAPSPGVSWAPDGEALLLTRRVDHRSTVQRWTLDGAAPTNVFRSDKRASATWLPDGRVMAVVRRAGVRSPLRGMTVGLGPPDALRWTGVPMPSGTHSLVAALDHDLLVVTDHDAPQGRLVRIDLDHPRRWHDVIPEGADRLRAAARVGDELLLVYAHDGAQVLRRADLSGGDPRDTDVRASVHLSPRAVGADLALVTSASADGAQTWAVRAGQPPEVVAPADGERVFETVYGASADGTLVPVSLVRRVGPADPSAPIFLGVYGGFNNGGQLSGGATVDLWLAAGGAYAWAHPRGGDERGDAWHEAAMKEHKSVTIDDTIAAAEGLRAAGHTGGIVLYGASNGGLTVAATLARRPDLFSAGVAVAGVHDLLRGPRFGRWWPAEYGRLRGPAQASLRALSPVHNLPAGPLPPLLIATGVEDDTVSPSHSYKLAAAWRDLPGGPVLLYVHPTRTHPARRGARESLTGTLPTRSLTAARTLAFALRAVGVTALPEP